LVTGDVERDRQPPAPGVTGSDAARIKTEPASDRLAQLEGELASYKRAKRLADLEVVELRAHLREAEQLRQSFYYRVGRIVVEFFTTFRGFVFFWPRLIGAIRDELRDGRRHRSIEAPKSKERRPADFAFEVDAVRAKIVEAGPAATAQWVRDRQLPARLAARLLIEVARSARQTDIALAIELGSEVLRLDRSEQRVKWLAMVLAEAGTVTEALQLMHEIAASGIELTGTEKRAADELARLVQLLKHPPPLSPRRSVSARLPRCRRVLLVTQHALPLRWSIAAVRLHATAQAIRLTGREVVVAVLPTDNASRRIEIGQYVRHSLDGIWYYELAADAMPTHEETVALLERFALDQDVDLLEAELALAPANVCLEVGRRLDLPAVLDYLGDEPFPAPQGVRAGESERVVLTRAQQRRLADEADACVRWLPSNAIGFAGQHALEHYGAIVSVERELGREASGEPTLRDDARLAGRRVIGFFGEAPGRYDFEILARLPGALVSRHGGLAAPGLLVAGLGRALEKLQSRAVEEGFGDRLKFVRAPAYAEVPLILSSMDIFVAPLKGDSAMLVSPPFEIVQALAFGVPVVTPATGEARRWFEAGLPLELAPGCAASDLADTVAALLGDPSRLMRASDLARGWAQRNASFDGLTSRLNGLYRQFEGIGAERRARR
jgi:glycosyltransferase involved in cell wall biosynthesis